MKTVPSWEIRCPYCGMIDRFYAYWPKVDKRCWRELPEHNALNPNDPANCPGTGLVVESEFFTDLRS